jgi:hypothetical protein
VKPLKARRPATAIGEPSGSSEQLGRKLEPQAKPPRPYKQRLSHRTGQGKHPLADRGHDMYLTQPLAVTALLRVERLPRGIWEPAAGKGAIVKVLREAGHTVVASDLIRYPGCRLDFAGDFLATTRVPRGVSAIVTNPPYKDAQAFIEHGLELVPIVFVLLRILFLESEVRAAFFDRGHLERVHVFRDRLKDMHRDGWTGPKASPAMTFAWFVFNRNYRGLPTLDWLSADESKRESAQ